MYLKNKKIAIFIIFVIIFQACTSSQNSNNDLYNCILESYKNKNVDYEAELEIMEKQLINKGLLKDNSSKSYYKLLEKFHENQEIFQVTDEELMLWVNLSTGGLVLDSTCLKIMTEHKQNDEKLIWILSVYENSFEIYSDYNFKLIAEDYMNIYSAKDFKNPVYKMTLVWLWAFYNSDSVVLGRNLPPPPNNENVSKENILTVLITKDNEILVNSELTKIVELKNIVKDFIKNAEKEVVDIEQIGEQEVSKAVISLQNNRETSYNFYMQVQNSIVQSFNDLRDEFSMEYFNEKFDGLPPELQDAVRKKYPLNISEVESTSLK